MLTRENGHNNTMRDLVFLIGGLGIGSGIALLLAPTTGEDLRYRMSRGRRKIAKNIARGTDELRDHAGDFLDYVHDLRDRGSKLLHFA